VRDHLLNQRLKDWDIEVFGIEARRLERILRGLGPVNAVGRAFGVFKVRPRHESYDLDVSIPRRDSKVGPGHRGIAVEGDPTMTPREASTRRDLTINAMMFDLTSHQLLDPHDGQVDLQHQRLRAVDSDTFLEDPLRALRVVQFAARFCFLPDTELIELCRTAALEELPAERVQGEWRKLMLTATRPSVGLAIARQTGILAKAFPEFAPHDSEPLCDALDTLAEETRDLLREEGRRWAVMLSTWLARTPVEAAEATLDRLWLHRVGRYPVRDNVLAAIRHLDAPIDSDRALRRLSTHCELEVTLHTRHALQGDALEALSRAKELGILHAKPTALLQGRDLLALGMSPGPEVGRILKAVYQLQVDGQLRSSQQALDAAKALAAQEA
jgi:tRNA nucleotidyltransferase (CCA-adding enzyme)